jgi:hypothetical protein
MPISRRSSLSLPRSLALCLVLTGCAGEEHVDEAALCFVSATDELVVRVSWECGSDHRGAELSCDVTLEDDGALRVVSVFVDGKDPNDACAPPLEAECTSPPLADGTYEVRYGDETVEITVPGMAEPSCGQG